jgi:hypothetical protein
MAPSSMLVPNLPVKHHPVPAGERSSRRADGLVPNGGGQVNNTVQENDVSRETNHEPPAPTHPGWAFGWPHPSNQSCP